MTLGGKRKASFYVFTRIDQMWNQRTLSINRGYITFEWVLKIRKFLFTKTYTFTCKHRQPAGNPRIELKLLRITFNCWGDVGWTVKIHILAIVWPTPFLKLNFLPLNHILQQISDIKFVWTCFRLWMNNLLHCCITSVLAHVPWCEIPWPWMVCTTFDESLWIVCDITNIHVIARFTIQLMKHNS